ncbi:hypothetical protein, partial [Rhizobium leguminosarum]|uniref:hypothetical protein n=1 Tax=Rhizobium leguminosarum TaxID=384 RepID=UPI003D026431
KELANVKYQKRAEDLGTGKPDWLGPFVYVGSINSFCNVVTGEPLIPESFDNMFSIHLISKDPESESTKSGRPAILPRHFA